MEAPAGKLMKPVLAFIVPCLSDIESVGGCQLSVLFVLIRGQLAGLRSSTGGQHGSAVKPQKPSRPWHPSSLSQHPKPGAMDQATHICHRNHCTQKGHTVKLDG